MSAADWGHAGVDPTIMGIGPVPAFRNAMARAGAALPHFDLFEVNEAFAPQYLAVEKELGLPRDRTNVDGGAIAVGHPLAASSARITMHLLYALRQRGLRRGLRRLHRRRAGDRRHRGGALGTRGGGALRPPRPRA